MKIIIENIDMMTDEEELELKNYLDECNIEYKIELDDLEESKEINLTAKQEDDMLEVGMESYYERKLRKQREKRNKLCPNCKKNLIYPKYNLCQKCSGINRRNEKCYAWKGDKAGYKAIHIWIRKNKPKPQFCEKCKKNKPKQIANISGEYKRDINDYKWLCCKCHIKMDKIGEKSSLKQTIKIDMNKAKELRQKNMSYEAISKEMGVSRNTIWRRLNNLDNKGREKKNGISNKFL